MFSRSPAVPVVLAIDLAESAMGAVRPFLERKNLPVHALAAGEAFAWERVRAVLTGSIEGVRRARSAGHGLSVVFIAQTGSEELAIAAFRAGATDYFREPVDLEDLARSLSGNPPAPSTGGDSMIGASAAMRSIREYIVKAAAAESNVLITGETGTGKELVAEMIHNKSSRARRPLVCVNCAAIPDGLLESELFGYERGAFTGAQTSNAGKLEAANGGAAFFDEISEKTPYAQTKLLRATQGREGDWLRG